MSLVVVGSLNTDFVVTGARLPQPGETVVMSTFSEGHGGKGANQAAAAGALGATVHLVGAVGDDHRGAAAVDELVRGRVDTSQVVTIAGVPTGVATILVDADAENSIGVVPGANARLTGDQVVTSLRSIGGSQVTVVLSMEVPLGTVVAAAETAASLGWQVILNPAPAPEHGLPDALVARCDVIVPNETEEQSLGGAPGLLERGAGAVVVTRGRHGARIHRTGRPPADVPALPVTAVDTTGAGDVFTAALATALDSGSSLLSAVRFAAAAGGLAVTGVGARGGLPTADSVRRVMDEPPSS